MIKKDIAGICTILTLAFALAGCRTTASGTSSPVSQSPDIPILQPVLSLDKEKGLAREKNWAEVLIFEYAQKSVPDNLCVAVATAYSDGGVAVSCFTNAGRKAPSDIDAVEPVARFRNEPDLKKILVFDYTPRNAPDHRCSIIGGANSDGGASISCSPAEPK